ncbi:GntR family transcriptional regulator [Nonomuraea typhae]|uniref:GntR family transcriptional regulator n=1 Tax=Nonomuraea typhae TaxID=2603600 RepID=UPI0012FC14D8|nr:GntR family transcriptional regulator [Nonomuraea typhae]
MPREARYRAIARELSRLIESGELPPGERLPTEDALAAEHGVHRLTARQAMVELRRAGLVETRHGLGSFVRRQARRVEVGIDPATRRHRPADLLELAEAFGDGEELVATASVRHPVAERHLGVAEVHEITTLLRTGGVPAILSRYHLRDALPFDPRAGVLGALKDFHYAWHAISAELADLDDQELLAAEPGTAMLVREGLVADEAGRPLCHIVRRCRGDMIAFVTRYE